MQTMHTNKGGVLQWVLISCLIMISIQMNAMELDDLWTIGREVQQLIDEKDIMVAAEVNSPMQTIQTSVHPNSIDAKQKTIQTFKELQKQSETFAEQISDCPECQKKEQKQLNNAPCLVRTSIKWLVFAPLALATGIALGYIIIKLKT